MRSIVFMLVVGVAGSAALHAQAPASPSPSAELPSQASGATFRSGVDLVSLTVTVTDNRRQLVKDLKAEDFAVLEDGVQQTVTFFGADNVPLDLVLMIDSSGSMREKLAAVQSAAIGLLRSLHATDRVELVEFRSAVTVKEPFSTDRQKIERAIDALHADGDTSLYTATYVTLRNLAAEPKAQEIRRRAIVLLSDGQDTKSMVTFDDVLDLARRTGVTIYTVSLNTVTDHILNRRGVEEGTYGLQALADATGARAFFPSGIDDVRRVYDTIAAELGSQYAIGYQPRNAADDGHWRQVAIQVTDRPGVRARARQGYFAGSGYAALAGLLHH